MLFRYNKRISKYFSNLLSDNVGSVSSLDGLFERPSVTNGDRSIGPAIRGIYSGFFLQTICSINMVEYFFMKQWSVCQLLRGFEVFLLKLILHNVHMELFQWQVHDLLF